MLAALRSWLPPACGGSLDASLAGSLLFLITSIYFCALDVGYDVGARSGAVYLPPAGLRVLNVFAGFGVFFSSACYLWAWQGAAPGDAPSAVALAAEYANVVPSAMYMAATWVAAADSAAGGCSVGGCRAAVYALQVTSNVLYLLDSLLYAAAWWADVRAAGPVPRRGLDLRDANFLVNATYVAAALIYVCAGAVPFVNGDVQAQQGSGRLLLSHPVVRAVTQAADFLYLACAVACLAAYRQDAADAAAADDAAKPPGLASAMVEREQQPDGPPFDVFRPLLALPSRVWRALISAKEPAARGDAASPRLRSQRRSVRVRAASGDGTPGRTWAVLQTPARPSAARAMLERQTGPPDTAVVNPLAR